MTTVGDTIKIISLTTDANGKADPSAKQYEGRVGTVNYIDDLGILHGTWGDLGILPCDSYEIIKKN